MPDRAESNFENDILLSLSQKIFSKNLELYPKGIKFRRQKTSDADEETDGLSKIIQALKDKRALVINYGRDKKDRIIEPYRLVRKNSDDFYLLAYDRSKKDLRRFILPRLTVKKELREDFLSQKKITANDLNFHPLAFTKGEATILKLEISPLYIESFQNFLQEFSFHQEDRFFTLTTSNPEALYPFFLKSPNALGDGSSESFRLGYKKFLHSINEMYTFVS